jgi:hypothetical protein
MAKKERMLTPMQEAFLDALLGEARGNYRTAMRIAGYADTVSTREVMKALREEIVEASKNYLALNAPKAAMKMLDLLDDPSAAGASNTIKVAQQVLDRAGAKAPEENSGLKIPSGGLFILPAKNIQTIDAYVEKEDDDE